jgi:hypothetical protein
VLVADGDDGVAALIGDEVAFAVQPAESTTAFTELRGDALYRLGGVINMSTNGGSEVLGDKVGHVLSVHIEAKQGN